MSSMSYCPFKNTASDLQQCVNDLYEAAENDCTLEQFIESRSSDYERDAVRRMYHLCQEFLVAYEDMEQF